MYINVHLTQDSLQVVVKRVSLLLNKLEGYTQLVIDTFRRTGIHSCHALYLVLADTRDNRNRAAVFTRRFKGASRDLILCHKQLSFFRCTLMYMSGRWEYDHEYFQRMIEREQRVDIKAVGVIIANLCEALHNDSSSNEGPMPGL